MAKNSFTLQTSSISSEPSKKHNIILICLIIANCIMYSATVLIYIATIIPKQSIIKIKKDSISKKIKT